MSLSTNDLPIDNVPDAPPPEDTADKETIDPEKPNLACTSDPTRAKAHRQVVGVENASQHMTFNRINDIASKPTHG
jgi:hypothetical protein